MERKSFLDQEAPAGYIAGSARGAVGFRLNSNPDSFSRGVAVVSKEEEEDENDGNGKLEGVIDNGILSESRRDDEDEEADRIYEEIEKKIIARKSQSKVKTPPAPTETNNNKPQFSDLKDS